MLHKLHTKRQTILSRGSPRSSTASTISTGGVLNGRNAVAFHSGDSLRFHLERDLSLLLCFAVGGGQG